MTAFIGEQRGQSARGTGVLCTGPREGHALIESIEVADAVDFERLKVHSLALVWGGAGEWGIRSLPLAVPCMRERAASHTRNRER